MGARDYYKLGSWNAICDRCGFKYRAEELRLEWDGLRVCFKCWEPRHPQELIRGIKDDQSVPWSRPESPPQFINDTCPIDGVSARVDLGVVDCMIVDLDIPPT